MSLEPPATPDPYDLLAPVDSFPVDPALETPALETPGRALVHGTCRR